MPTPIELALSTLLPTIAFLPPELITLATSFVAQSRSKAASLKPEEEIGRTYACAHIACERLAKKLNLEVGKPVPPVKPRVYAKLKGYLDGVLEVKSRRGGGAGGGDATPTQNATPSTRTGSTRTPTSGVKRARPVDEAEDVATPTSLPVVSTPATTDQQVPEFVMPLIRAICKSNNTANLAPHISVGASYAVREITSRHAKRSAADEPSAKRRRRTPTSGREVDVEKSTVEAGEVVPAGKWPALCLALFLFTAAKMEGVDVQSAKMKEMRRRGGQAVKAFCEDKRRILPEEVRGQDEGLESSVTFYMLEAEDCGWLEMEWYGNVPVREDGIEHRDEQDDGRSDHEEETGPVTPRKRAAAKTPLRRKEKHGGKKADGWEEDVGPAGLLPGLGTMFQPAVDWLSEERRAEFGAWKKEILREVAVVESRA